MGEPNWTGGLISGFPGGSVGSLFTSDTGKFKIRDKRLNLKDNNDSGTLVLKTAIYPVHRVLRGIVKFSLGQLGTGGSWDSAPGSAGFGFVDQHSHTIVATVNSQQLGILGSGPGMNASKAHDNIGDGGLKADHGYYFEIKLYPDGTFWAQVRKEADSNAIATIQRNVGSVSWDGIHPSRNDGLQMTLAMNSKKEEGSWFDALKGWHAAQVCSQEALTQQFFDASVTGQAPKYGAITLSTSTDALITAEQPKAIGQCVWSMRGDMNIYPPIPPAKPPWVFTLCKLDGTAIGEIPNCYDRRVDLMPLNQLPVASFRIRSDNQLLYTETGGGKTALDLLYQGDALLRVYKKGKLVYVGQVTGISESGSGGGVANITVSTAGLFWRLAYRLIGKSLGGYFIGSGDVPVDRGEIISDILANVNADGNCGLRIGVKDTSSSTIITSEAGWTYKVAAEAIVDLSTALNGPDFDIEPIEPYTDGGGLVLGKLNIYGAKGQQRGAIIEYGTGLANMREYTRDHSNQGLMNKGYILPPGWPDQTQEQVSTDLDQTSIDDRGLYEGTVSTDLEVKAFRDALIQEHIRLRKHGKEVITFQLAKFNELEYGRDYEVGDIITGRAAVDGLARFDALFRIYGIQFDIDAEAGEDTTLTLVEQV